MKNTVKVILNNIWALKPKKKSNRIIYYHSISNEGIRSHNINSFYEQMNWLKQMGYTSITLSELPAVLLGQSKVNEPWVVITFDDGYKDNVEFALPILEEFGLVATFFIVSSWVNSSDYRYRGYQDVAPISKDEILRLVESGMEIGSHTHTHRMCTRVLDESFAELNKEISLSKEILQEMIGQEVNSFSYPNGQKGAFSKETRDVLLVNGIKISCTTLWGKVNETCDILSLPRCEISNMDSLFDFKAKMLGRRDYLFYIHRLRDQSKVWFED